MEIISFCEESARISTKLLKRVLNKLMVCLRLYKKHDVQKGLI